MIRLTKYKVKPISNNIIVFDEKLGFIFETDLLPFGTLPNLIEEIDD